MRHHRTSILIADDHEVVRNGIRSYLETISDFHVVGEASSGEEALSISLRFFSSFMFGVETFNVSFGSSF